MKKDDLMNEIKRLSMDSRGSFAMILNLLMILEKRKVISFMELLMVFHFSLEHLKKDTLGDTLDKLNDLLETIADDGLSDRSKV